MAEVVPVGWAEPTVAASIVLSQLGFSSIGLAAILARLFGRTRALAALTAYGLYVRFSKAPLTGGAPWKPFRESQLWDLHARYFSASLRKTAELPADKGPYLFAVHPHGILSLTMPPIFASNGARFADTFPGIELRVSIVTAPFYMPVMREIALWSGCISCEKPALLHSLGTDKHSVAVVVGGADEALLAGSGKMRLVLKDRLGFVRIAVQTGSTLVPCITFGENGAFQRFERMLARDPEHSALLRRAQIGMMKTLGFSMPMFYGCGLVGHTPSLIPDRVRLTTVVGEPLPRVHLDPKDPAFERAVAELHAEYMARVVALHAAHHEELGCPEDHELELLTVKEARAFSFLDDKAHLQQASL